LPLFISVLALVFADSRRRSPRVFIALPLLALWGNLHGTALLGACIVALHAFVTIVEDRVAHAPYGRSTVRAAVLAGGGFLALAANPYGFGVASYYRTMMINPPFASLVQEWKPSTLSATTAPFYALAFVAIVIAVRNRRQLTPTEAVVGLALLAAAVNAMRSITWFGLTTLVLVAPLIHLRRVPGKRFAAPARAAVLLGGLASLVGALVAFPGSVSAHQQRAWSTRGAAALRDAAARHPAARVLADDRHADFLLWEEPKLTGRLLADVRFEVLTRVEVKRLARFEQDPRTHDAIGADLVVLNPKSQPFLPWRAHGWKQLYVDSSIGVFERSRPTTTTRAATRR
jgi:hypothetical protein